MDMQTPEHSECPSCKRITELINWYDDGLEWWGCRNCFNEYGDGMKGKEIPCQICEKPVSVISTWDDDAPVWCIICYNDLLGGEYAF